MKNQETFIKNIHLAFSTIPIWNVCCFTHLFIWVYLIYLYFLDQNFEFEPSIKQNINLIDYLKPYFSLFPDELYTQRKVIKKQKVVDIPDINVDLLEENEESNEEEDEEGQEPAEDEIDLEDEGDYAYQSFDDDDDQVEEEGFDGMLCFIFNQISFIYHSFIEPTL